MSRVIARHIPLLLGILMMPSVALAGNNAGGTAQLSWSSSEVVTNLSSVPSGTVPLYLQLSGVPDVHQLAVTVQWNPDYHSSAHGYAVVSGSQSQGDCGWSSPAGAPQEFQGDSTYTWSIGFSADAPRTCVTYVLDCAHAAGQPATFCPTSVKVVDSDGAVDELTAVGGATILNGADACPVEVHDVFPSVAPPARLDTLVVYGNNLTAETQVALSNGGTEIAAESVVQDAPGSVTAAVAVPETFQGAIDVIVRTPANADTLIGRLQGIPLLDPVHAWEAAVDQSDSLPQASVLTNVFDDPGSSSSFPVPIVMVRRFTDHSTIGADGRISPSFSAEVAPLQVDSQGHIASGQLAFLNTKLVSVDPSNPRLAAVTTNQIEPRQSKAWTTKAQPLRIQTTAEDPFLEWEQAPNEKWLVLHTARQTRFLQRDRAAPLLELPERSYYGVFSKDATRYAAVANQGGVQKWIVVGSAGQPIREGAPSRADLSQLQLSPNGRVLTFARQNGTVSQTVAVNLASGQEAILANVPDGTRYYSADGRTMLVLTPYPGALHLFDVTDPLHPSELGTPVQTTDGHFITGAVSADGSIVAVQMLEPLNNPSQSLTRVVAYDRGLNQRAVVSEQATNQGLQFEGRFLFVGVQRHPIPAGFTFTSTDHIQVFDLSGI